MRFRPSEPLLALGAAARRAARVLAAMARLAAVRAQDFAANRTIEGRILLAFILVACLGFAVLGTALSYQLQGHLETSLQQDLQRKARRINFALNNGSIDWSTPAGHEAGRSLLDFLARALDVRVLAFDASGQILAGSRAENLQAGFQVDPADVKRVLAGETVSRRSDGELLEEPVTLVIEPMGTPEKITGGLIVAAPMTQLAATLGGLRQTILWSSLGVILISALVASFLGWSIARPVQALRARLERLIRREYDDPVVVTSGDELGHLAESLNELSQRLQQADLDRQRLESGRNQLFQDLSHELRTPLTAVLGFVEALRDEMPEDEDTRRRYLDIIHAGARHLDRLVQDMLQLARLDAGLDTPLHIIFDIAPMLCQLAERFRYMAAATGNEILLHGIERPAYVRGDPDRLEQVFDNLVKNALQHTENGRVEIYLKAEPDRVVVDVADTGHGIPPGEIDRIWDRFFRGSASRALGRGSGLGLAIVKQLVELHQGEIQVTSQPGIGSTFTVFLPRAAEESALASSRVS